MQTSLDYLSLSNEFTKAFNYKDANALADLFAKDCLVIDPNNRITSQDELRKIHIELFSKTTTVAYKIINLYQVKYLKTTVIEFEITLDKAVLSGVDIIDWDSDYKIKELRCYFNNPS